MEALIFISIITIIVILSRYIITENQRKKSHKKFMKDFNEFDTKYKTK